MLRQSKWVKEVESPLEPQEHSREKYSDILTVFKKHKEPLVILGDPGAGKSVSFRHALRQIATHQLRWYKTAPLIPVYIPCGHYTETSNDAPLDVEEFLTKYVSNTLKASGQSGLDFKEYLARGRLVLFFDALDEMPRTDYAERTRLLRLFAEKFSHNRIFFSCRKLDYDKRLQATEVTIRPFDRGRRRKFLKKALAKSFNRKAVLSLIYRLETDAQTGELLSNPFFCQLVVFYITALRRLVVNRISLSLACATNAGLDSTSDIWTSAKESGLILLEKGTPIEQVRIAKELVVHDNDVQIGRQLRRLLTGKSNWVASEIFAALLSFRIPHVGYETDKQIASSAALEFYTTFNTNRSKLLIIDFLWETAEFDRELINRLTDLAGNEQQTELSDRLWNLIYELETREQRVA